MNPKVSASSHMMLVPAPTEHNSSTPHYAPVSKPALVCAASSTAHPREPSPLEQVATSALARSYSSTTVPRTGPQRCAPSPRLRRLLAGQLRHHQATFPRSAARGMQHPPCRTVTMSGVGFVRARGQMCERRADGHRRERTPTDVLGWVRHGRMPRSSA